MSSCRFLDQVGMYASLNGRCRYIVGKTLPDEQGIVSENTRL